MWSITKIGGNVLSEGGILFGELATGSHRAILENAIGRFLQVPKHLDQTLVLVALVDVRTPNNSRYVCEALVLARFGSFRTVLCFHGDRRQVTQVEG